MEVNAGEALHWNGGELLSLNGGEVLSSNGVELKFLIQFGVEFFVQ